MKNYLVFIRSEYLRDTQAFRCMHLPDDGDIFDDACENGWLDSSGDLLIIERYDTDLASIQDTLKLIYPDADPAIFRILEINTMREIEV